MDIDPSLIGLNNYELKTYKSLIILGKSKATQICQLSGVPQGKIYSVLKSLMEKGLVDAILNETKEYTLTSPDILLNILKKKKLEVERAQSELENIKDSLNEEKNSEESIVVVRQGKKSFNSIVKILNDPKKYEYSIKWKIGFYKEWAKKEKDLIKQGIDIKVLTRNDNETKKSIKKWLKVHKNIKQIENEGVLIDIIDDSEVMITIINCDSTILIRDSAFAKLIKKMFVETYKSAPKINKK